MMNRDVPFMIALAAIAAALLLIAMILWEVNKEQAAQIDDLRAELASVQADEPNEGGAETDPPPRQAVSSRYTFPIAESDYLELTSPFGYRVSPILQVERYHQGVDIAAAWRAQVVAAADGVVAEHWPPPDGYYRGHDVYGGLVVIEHENGWRTLYAHLSETRVHTGQAVHAGQVLGRVGSTGRSRGAHLHFEMMDAAGKRLNALLYVQPGGQG